MTLDLTCSGKAESLLSTGVSLNFWHCFFYLNCYYYMWQRIYQALRTIIMLSLLLCMLLRQRHMDTEFCASYSSPLRAFRASALTLALASNPPLAGIAFSSACLGARISASRFSRSSFCWLFLATPAFFGAR